ncbi:MAG TPA: MFS transporter, partial [Solirubrobacteraceae bacterium]
MAITSVAVFMVMLDNRVVTTAIPVIRHDLHAGLSVPQWTVSAYTLTFAVLLLTGAALGDRFGRRRPLAVGIGIFTAASAGRTGRRLRRLGEAARRRDRERATGVRLHAGLLRAVLHDPDGLKLKVVHRPSANSRGAPGSSAPAWRSWRAASSSLGPIAETGL